MSDAVTLWVPDLLNPLRIKEANEQLQALKLPALQSLLAKADRFSAKKQNQFDQANYLFHQPKHSAYASVMARAEIKDYDPSVFWLRVDPVQMIADRDSLVLIPGDDLAITEAESQALLESFNEHFAIEHVSLEYAAPTRWYLRIVQPVDIQTHSLESVAYKAVNDYYPAGNAATYWRKMINETQMLFFNHPVNESRRESGMPEINSIWIWGEGVLDSKAVVERDNAMVWSEDTYLSGLACLSGAILASSPTSHSGFAEAKNYNDELQKMTHHLIRLDALTDDLDKMELNEWLEALKALENNWLGPLVHALKRKEIDSLLLDFGSGQRFHLKPKHLNRFWRFKKSLAQL